MDRNRVVSDDWDCVPVFGVPSGGRLVIRPSAYALINDEQGRIALVRTNQGTFLPGGGIESNESPRDAVIREAREECGLIVRPGDCVARAIQFVYSVAERADFEKRSIFIECDCAGLDPTNAEAGHELIWTRVDDAIEALSHESQSWAIRTWKVEAPKKAT